MISYRDIVMYIVILILISPISPSPRRTFCLFNSLYCIVFIKCTFGPPNLYLSVFCYYISNAWYERECLILMLDHLTWYYPSWMWLYLLLYCWKVFENINNDIAEGKRNIFCFVPTVQNRNNSRCHLGFWRSYDGYFTSFSCVFLK